MSQNYFGSGIAIVECLNPSRFFIKNEPTDAAASG